MKTETEIGYVCSRGHFFFQSDPEYDDSCSSHRVATVYVERDPNAEISPYEYKELLEECMTGLGQKIETWRRS